MSVPMVCGQFAEPCVVNPGKGGAGVLGLIFASLWRRNMTEYYDFHFLWARGKFTAMRTKDDGTDTLSCNL